MSTPAQINMSTEELGAEDGSSQPTGVMLFRKINRLTRRNSLMIKPHRKTTAGPNEALTQAHSAKLSPKKNQSSMQTSSLETSDFHIESLEMDLLDEESTSLPSSFGHMKSGEGRRGTGSATKNELLHPKVPRGINLSTSHSCKIGGESEFANEELTSGEDVTNMNCDIVLDGPKDPPAHEAVTPTSPTARGSRLTAEEKEVVMKLKHLYSKSPGGERRDDQRVSSLRGNMGHPDEGTNSFPRGESLFSIFGTGKSPPPDGSPLPEEESRSTTKRLLRKIGSRRASVRTSIEGRQNLPDNKLRSSRKKSEDLQHSKLAVKSLLKSVSAQAGDPGDTGDSYPSLGDSLLSPRHWSRNRKRASDLTPHARSDRGASTQASDSMRRNPSVPTSDGDQSQKPMTRESSGDWLLSPSAHEIEVDCVESMSHESFLALANSGINSSSGTAVGSAPSVDGSPWKSSSMSSSGTSNASSGVSCALDIEKSTPVSLQKFSSKGLSRLECVHQLLKGVDIMLPNGKFRNRFVQGWMWVSPDFEILHWKTASSCSTGMQLSSVFKVKSVKERILSLTDAKKDKFEVLLPSKEKLEVWISALAVLVHRKCIIKVRGGDPARISYSVVMDYWKNKALRDRKRLSDYVLLQTLGRGAFGKVKLAISLKTQRFCAVKIISKATTKKQQRMSLAVGKDSSNLYMRELAVMKKINHPNIVNLEAVFDSSESRETYIVMEYMPCGIIMSSSQLENAKHLSEARARQVFIDLLNAVEYLHYQGIVHRDIKPDNILVKADGTCKLSDFGAAKIYDETEQTMLRSSVGTPAFTAPELCLSDKAPAGPQKSFKADIWSLGATLYYLIYGRAPFMARTVFEMYDSICTGQLQFPDNPNISEECKDCIRKILVKNPRNRIQIESIWECGFLKEFSGHRVQDSLKAGMMEQLSITDSDVRSLVSSIR